MITIALLLALVTQSAGAAGISVPDAGTSVPMLDVGGRPMVDVMVNGKGPYPFILDTGASHTVVSADLLTDLGVANQSGVPQLDELRIGDAVLRSVRIGRVSILGALGGPNPPRGVLSALAFPGYLVTLDYRGRRVTIARGALPAADGKRIFQYRDDEILPVVPVRVAGKEYRIHVDSGSPAGLSLPTRYQHDLPLAGEPVEAGRARTAGGEFPIFNAPLNGAVELGEFPLSLTRISLTDVRPGPKPGIGNIGADVLKTFTLTVDSQNRRLRFAR